MVWSHHCLTWYICWPGVPFVVISRDWALEKWVAYKQNSKEDTFSTEPQNKQANTIFRTLYFIKDNDKKVQTFAWTTKNQNYDSTQEIPSICFSAFFIKPILHTSTNKIILSTLPLADTQWILLIFFNNWLISYPVQHSH